MFEQEVEMEQRQSSVVPLLLIVAMILTIVGVAGYYLNENRKVLSKADASNLITVALNETGPATIHFQVGQVIASVQEKPHDANYRLLAKAGLLTIGKDQGRTTPVALTAKGRSFFAEIPGVAQAKDEKDRSITYTVPIAERKVVGAPKVTMKGIGRATVEFAWVWEPNKMGELLDASGPLVKSFNTWDRATLIDKYGARFFHGETTKVAMSFAKEGNAWHQVTE